MSTSLHDRLADLADDAPTGGPEPGLWDRATRLHRRRRAGTVVIAAVACLALLAVAGLSWFQARSDVQPAGGRDGLPDRVYTPSKWLPSAEHGRLALAFNADRGSLFDTALGVVGVSASTGEYGFVDLPAVAGEWRLSPDGRHIAFWQTGPTTDKPNDHMSDEPVAAVAVYDTTTGEVRSQPIETEHGLQPDALVWTDARTLVLSYGQIVGGPDDPDMEQGMSTFPVWSRWDLADPAPTSIDLPDEVGHGYVNGAFEGLVSVAGDDQSYWFVDPHDPASPRQVFVDGETTGSLGPVVEHHGGRIAAVGGGPNLGNPNRVVVAVAAQPSTKADPEPFRRISGTAGTYEVLAWPDDQLVVERKLGSWEQTVLARVDPESGETTTLVRLPKGMFPRYVQYASDLFTAPTLEGIEPPTPTGSRTTLALVLLTTSAAGIALLWWRRRVRP
jgi:hypothetical protein